MHALPRLDVSHVVNYYHCDLRCSYCISDWSNQRGSRDHKPVDVDPAHERALLRSVASLPYRIHLSLSNAGEPLVTPWLLDEVVRLCNHEGEGRGVEALTLFTNLHASWERVIEPFLARTNPARLALGCTLHDSVLSEAEVEDFYQSCQRARDLGVLVMVVYVVRPGALEQARSQKQRCDRLGLPFLPNAIVATEGGRGVGAQTASPYTAAEIEIARELTETPHAHKLLFEARSTYGEPCGAGRRYVFVASNGDVFPCFSVKNGPIRLGNVLDGSFQLREAPLSCPVGSCGCPNETTALHIVDDRYERSIDHRYLKLLPGISQARLEDGYRPSIYRVRNALRALAERAHLAG